MKIELTPYHMITFIYMGFAHLTDSVITKEESEEIEQKIAKWMNVSYKNINQYNDIVKETTDWYNSLEDQDRVNTMLSMAAGLNKEKFMDMDMRKTLLSDIRDIAVADGRFGEEEKRLHDILARELGINVLTSDALKKRKSIGFKNNN